MLKSRIMRLLLFVSLVITMIGLMGTAALAADETPTPTPTPTPPPPTLTLDSKYPSISADSGAIYTYDVSIIYQGTERKTFTMDVTAPQGWSAFTSSGYPEKEITSVQIDPGAYGSSTESIKLNLGPNYGLSPDPGNYNVTLKVSSGSLVASITLEAKVKAKYALSMTTESGNLATSATAGRDNHFSFKIVNSGSAVIDNLNLTSSAPSGWTITFKPTRVDSLGAGQTQQIDAVITPTEGKTIAGDYMITLKSDNGKNTASMDVRVTVETPSIWGWLAFVIVAVVILGLLVLFWKMGRR
jgi:uncharacterized membrane protein